MSAFLQVPARNDVPWYRFTVTLTGVVYTLTFRYNTRMDRWALDVADASNNALLVGVPLLIERDLIGRFVISGLPPGTLFAADFTNQDTQPTRFSFGTDHGLIYVDPDG